MSRFAQWLHYFRSLLLAFRVVAFEKPGLASALAWLPFATLFILVAWSVSPAAGGIVSVAALAAYFGFRRWCVRNIYRLVRPSDRIEYAVMGTENEGYRQSFEEGFVIRTMHRDDVRRSGALPDDLIEGSEHFFLVRTRKKNRIVAFDWITGIEIDNDEVLKTYED